MATDYLYMQKVHEFNLSSSKPSAKFAITGSQNTSMPVYLAQRKLDDMKDSCFVKSKRRTIFDDDEPFVLDW